MLRRLAPPRGAREPSGPQHDGAVGGVHSHRLGDRCGPKHLRLGGGRGGAGGTRQQHRRRPRARRRGAADHDLRETTVELAAVAGDVRLHVVGAPGECRGRDRRWLHMRCERHLPKPPALLPVLVRRPGAADGRPPPARAGGADGGGHRRSEFQGRPLPPSGVLRSVRQLPAGRQGPHPGAERQALLEGGGHAALRVCRPSENGEGSAGPRGHAWAFPRLRGLGEVHRRPAEREGLGEDGSLEPALPPGPARRGRHQDPHGRSFGLAQQHRLRPEVARGAGAHPRALPRRGPQRPGLLRARGLQHADRSRGGGAHHASIRGGLGGGLAHGLLRAGGAALLAGLRRG
mmetsp:Transcript_82004/g.237114  ORF Transcript_82004/g.237114 Transcript_82004/m.237114 type:complete len:346 (+) Transcript_82004:71-1108(+)